MNRLFQPEQYYKVPDGTFVSPFLTATDANQAGLPRDLLGEMSIAAGRIDGGVASAVHLHPVVTQVTYLLSGELTVRMKAPDDSTPYALTLAAGQASICLPRMCYT